MRNDTRTSLSVLLSALYLAAAIPSSAQTSKPQTKQKPDEEEEVIVLSPFCVSGPADVGYRSMGTLGGTRVSGASMGATPGGAQDISYFRSGAGRGEIPHPNTFTAEGLFSEHDLPLELGAAPHGQLFRVQTAAIPARLETMTEVRYLAQLGLSSGLKANEWRRAPLNLVAVIDKSGSMSGQPLALVRESLKHALNYMQDGDQLAIVLYGDRSHVHLASTAVNDQTRTAIKQQIDAIASAGSTNMEAGLQVGYALARETAATFKGNTRVMLFTDERPNVGNTVAAGFMAMAETASRDGIGLTTIGVGVQFGAELATKISSVRGGNLFFFSDGEQMKKTFASDFDTMVTELAHAFSVKITPASGYRLNGIFGVPAEALRWEGNAVVLDVATIFLSKRKGAIYYALSPDTNPHLPARQGEDGETLARVDFSYRDARDNQLQTAAASCELLDSSDTQPGLSRGLRLIDEYLTLKEATRLHLLENKQDAAFRLVSGLDARLHADADAALQPERALVRDIHNTLAKLSGHSGEVKPAGALAPVSNPPPGGSRRSLR